jgi:hypothetical protein
MGIRPIIPLLPKEWGLDTRIDGAKKIAMPKNGIPPRNPTHRNI